MAVVYDDPRELPSPQMTRERSWRPTLALLLIAAAVAGSPAAAQTGARPPPAGPQRKEWFALEITPIGLGFRYGDDYGSDPDLLQAGFGVTLRLLRQKAGRWYVTPVQVGVFGGSGPSFLAHAQVEGGLIIPVGSRELELGLAGGVGWLAIVHDSPRSCEGRCWVGGTGLLLSSVVRYTLVYAPNLAVAVGVRAVFPVTRLHDILGVNTAAGVLLLGGIELAFGR